jgi:hypothetical protein
MLNDKLHVRTALTSLPSKILGTDLCMVAKGKNPAYVGLKHVYMYMSTHTLPKLHNKDDFLLVFVLHTRGYILIFIGI